jgi:hypothetical protein
VLPSGQQRADPHLVAVPERRPVLRYDVFAKPRPLLDAEDAGDGTGCGADRPTVPPTIAPRGPAALSPAAPPSSAPLTVPCAHAADGKRARTKAATGRNLIFMISPSCRILCHGNHICSHIYPAGWSKSGWSKSGAARRNRRTADHRNRANTRVTLESELDFGGAYAAGEPTGFGVLAERRQTPARRPCRNGHLPSRKSRKKVFGGGCVAGGGGVAAAVRGRSPAGGGKGA